MPRRSLSVLGLVLILGAAPARADVVGPNERTVASQVVFTGLRDFPAYRFVIAVDPHRPDPKDIKNDDLPAPIPVRDGEPVSTDTIYFQDLRAIPADTPDPVTDAWVLASNAPTSGSFTLHPRRVQTESAERMARRSSAPCRPVQGRRCPPHIAGAPHARCRPRIGRSRRLARRQDPPRLGPPSGPVAAGGGSGP